MGVGSGAGDPDRDETRSRGVPGLGRARGRPAGRAAGTIAYRYTARTCIARISAGAARLVSGTWYMVRIALCATRGSGQVRKMAT